MAFGSDRDPADTGRGGSSTATQSRGSIGRPLATMMTAPAPSARSSQRSTVPVKVDIAFSAGTLIHQFEVIRELGSGGMGTVFLARDTKLARLVALKFLNVTGGDIAERFVVEARATASCSHENIVVIHQVDEWQRAPYMALEFLEGSTLEDSLQQRAMSTSRVIEVMSAVARALVRAHSLGFVHCDLKPANIFLTRNGGVKVLDFGIAKFANQSSAKDLRIAEIHKQISHGLDVQRGASGVAGTLPYMSIEQWGLTDIDHRSDMWAMGIIFWEALRQKHPLGAATMESIVEMISSPDIAMPSLATVAPDLPAALIELVDRCLRKDKTERFSTTEQLLAALEQLAHGRGKSVAAGQSPFLGMAAFQESNAENFFGREQETAEAIARLEDNPLLVLAGPSGIGKSSFVRAGVVPALKQSGAWQVCISRPGRKPLHDLYGALISAFDLSRDSQIGLLDKEVMIERIAEEPGYLGAVLRKHAQRASSRILIFIDQFEEVFTLANAAERQAYLACLLGIADDDSSPLRLVISVRSDFLDRFVENPALRSRMTNGLMFMQSLGIHGLSEALERPIAMQGYHYEPTIVADIVSKLSKETGALPLLQFCASQLWQRRTQATQTITLESYNDIGGVEGALAQYAEGVVRDIPVDLHSILRTLLARLVTADGTRAIIDRSELAQIGQNSQVTTLVDKLVKARLLSVNSDGADTRIELVHESLIAHWPTLKRWRDEASEDTAFLHELRPAAKQWEAKSRSTGLLWSGDALHEARTFLKRSENTLTQREREFINAALAADNKRKTRKRALLVIGFVVLGAMVAASLVAVAVIRKEQQNAAVQRDIAQSEAGRAQKAQAAATEQLLALQKAQRETLAAEENRNAADSQRRLAEAVAAKTAQEQAKTQAALKESESVVAENQNQLQSQNQALQAALKEAVAAKKQATEASAELSRKLTAEQKRNQELENKAKGLAKELN
jgi:eukaryotic-like serine/threonine-protein kinase